jgi:outer membrane protein assembly factor BamD (BamD/ComL family)
MGVESIPIPEAIQSVNRQATGSALYWIAICQMDRNQPGTAITSFASYRRQYPDGEWFYPSLMNQALAELAQGRQKAAAETLAEANQEGNPEKTRAAIVLKRLQSALALQDKPAAQPNEATQDKVSASEVVSGETNESEPAAAATADESKP